MVWNHSTKDSNLKPLDPNSIRAALNHSADTARSCLHSAISTSWRSKTAENAATTPLWKFIDGRFSNSGLVDCCHNLLLAKDCLPGCRAPHTSGWLFCVDTVYLLHTVTAARTGLCLATPADRTVGEEGSTRFVDVIDTC